VNSIPNDKTSLEFAAIATAGHDAGDAPAPQSSAPATPPPRGVVQCNANPPADTTMDTATASNVSSSPNSAAPSTGDSRRFPICVGDDTASTSCTRVQ